MRFLGCFFIVLFVACTAKQSDADVAAINDWYYKINKNRYTQNDSLFFYANLIEEKSEGLAAEYNAMGHIAKGMYFSKKAEYDSSLLWFKKAIKLLEQSGADSLIGKAYNGLGNVYKNTGNYPGAISNYQLALAAFQRMQYSEGLAGVHSNLGQTYQLKEDYGTAKLHLQQSIKILSKNKLSNAYLNAIHTLANIYCQQNNTDSAMLLDNEGIILADQMSSPLFLSPFYNNKAKCLVSKKQYDSAQHYFAQSFLIDSLSNSKKQMSDSYLNMGELSIKTGKLALAERQLLQSLQLAEESGYRLGKQNVWKVFSELYTSQFRSSEALSAQKNYITLKDSLLNEKTEMRIAELRTQFEVGEKENRIKLQEASIKQQRMLIIAVVLFFSLMLFTVYGYYRKAQLKKAKEFDARMHREQEEATIKILTAEEKERQRIASDLHDGVGQTMTAAWLNLQAIGKRLTLASDEASLVKKTTELVGDSCLEIRQVSHNMMPNALTRKGLINAIREFTGQIDEGILSISFQAEDDLLALDKTTSIILYRVVQECINNVVKHAKATELDIAISQDEGNLSIMIEDNGVGIDKTMMQKQRGLGIQNIQSRIDYLKGSVEWDNTGNGTVVAIHIPIK